MLMTEAPRRSSIATRIPGRKFEAMWLAVSTMILSVAGPISVQAQLTTQPFQSEVRVDAIVAHSSGVEAGYGISIPAGIYVRTGLVGAVGSGRHGVESRADFITRVSLDPFRQSRG